MADSVQIGSEEFKVDLEQFNNTIATVSASRDAVESDLTQLKTELANLSSSWQSPAGETYAELQGSLASAANQTFGVLDEMVTRMKITQETYQNAELANTQNL